MIVNMNLLLAAALMASFTASQATAREVPAAVAAPSERPHLHADLAGRRASSGVRDIADWVVSSADNQGLPFVIVDKVEAEVFVFSPDGHLSGDAPALLGSARGDDSAPGIGDKALSQIGPDERTTPAGRFVASLGQDLGQKDVVWVDYKDAISLHRVITINPKEHRLQRLATPSPLDNRISYGCINVPVNFYETFIKPAFTGTNGIVYILPEKKTLQNTFKNYP
jgi:hypothetical protein